MSWRASSPNHVAIKREVGLLRLLVEKSAAMRDREREEGGAGGGGGEDDDDARGIYMIVLNELESIREEDKEQMVRQEHQHQHEYKQQEGGR